MNKNQFIVLSSSKWRKSLALVRNLGRLNYKVICCRRTFLEMASWSKFCYKSFNTKPSNYISDLIYLGKKLNAKYNKKPILIFCEDEDIILAKDFRSELKQYFKFLLPEKNDLDAGFDKLLLYKKLEHNKRLSALIPKTYLVSDVVNKESNNIKN